MTIKRNEERVGQGDGGVFWRRDYLGTKRGREKVPLNTVRESARDREEMSSGEGAESNLWFDIGSPWLSVSWKEGSSVSPWSTSRCFNEFTEALGMANALVYRRRKTGGCKFTSSSRFLGGTK